MLNEAYGKAATVATAESAFRASGIWPVNRNIFKDHMFVPSDMLQRHDSPTENEANTVNNPDNVQIPVSSSDSSSDAESTITPTLSQKKEIKKFKTILHEISPLRTRHPDHRSPSSSRSTGIAQKAQLITSKSHKLKLQQAEKKN